MELPSVLRNAVARVISLSGLSGDAADGARADLEQHFRDGLQAGRTPEELIERFGEPEDVAPLLGRSPGPPASKLRGRRSEGWWTSFLADLRFSARVLAKSPTLTGTAMAVVALGIAANTVVFTVINEALLRPLPVDDPSSLVDVWADVPGGNSFLSFSYLDYEAYREESAVLDELAAYAGLRLDFGEGEGAQGVVGQLSTDNYFGMLGLRPTLGRLSFGDNPAFGEEPVVVLAHAFWLSSMGGARDVIGTTVLLDGHSATVVGVGPEGFTGHFIGFPVDMWLPLTAADPLIPGFTPTDPSQKVFEMIGRSRAGVSTESVQAALNAIAVQLEARQPDLNRGHRVGVTPATGLDHSLQAPTLAFLAILATVSGLVLFIACLNVGSLVLVRVMSRDREMAIRLAIGAGAGRLVRQILTESLLLVLLGAVVGTWAALQINSFLSEFIRSLSGGVGLELGIDLRVLALTAAATLVATMVASAGPALYLMKKEPATALRSRGGGGDAGGKLRTFLVVGQVAVSVVLVTATGLFVRALAEGAQADPGYSADQLATFALSLDEWSEAPDEAQARLQQVVRETQQLQGVAGVSVSDLSLPNVARTPTPVDIPGVIPEAGQDQIIVDSRRVGADFGQVMGIPILRGRDFTETDSRIEPPVAVVSQEFVRRFWPDGDALGRTFRVRDVEVRVVGVAADVRYLVQDDSPDPFVYVSLYGQGLARPVVTVRSATPLALAGLIDDAVRQVVPGHARVRLVGARERLDGALFPQRIGSAIVGVMGLAALFLATVGLYGLLQFTVTRDRHELGVRLALGGSGADLLRVIVRKGLVLVGAGTLLGLAIALLAAPGLENFLVGVSPTDPVTYAAVIASFVAVALVASFLPARRAFRIQPAEALRGD